VGHIARGVGSRVGEGRMIGRTEVIAYLRRLADKPEGIVHRAWLFQAALMLDRDVNTIFRCSRCKETHVTEQREGDADEC
jgi:hypothetical protein